MFFHNINPVLVEFGPLEVRYYGLIYALSFLLGFFLIYHLAKKKHINLSSDEVSDLVFYNIITIILGARLVYVAFYNPSFYLANPLEAFAVWHGGLSFHGGMLGLVLGTWFFCKKKKKSFYEVMDIIVIPGALALALGRIGNFLNGELFGRVTNVPWCVDYSQSTYVRNPPSGCRHPSQLYESFYSFAMFLILWIVKDSKLPPGVLSWGFVFLYGVFRTLAEFFRQPDAQLGFVLGSLSMGQLLSIPMIIVAGWMLMSIYNQKV